MAIAKKATFSFLVLSIILALSGILTGCASGTPKVVWEKNFKAEGRAFDSGQQTADGGYILAGSCRNVADYSGNRIMLLAKTDSSGDLEWEKTYMEADRESVWEVRQTSDGGYILTGYQSVVSGRIGPFLMRTDTEGNLMWLEGYDIDGKTSQATAVAETPEGGFIFVGHGAYGPNNEMVALIAGTDPEGTLLWRKTYGDELGSEFNSIERTSDGKYIIAGTKNIGSLENGEFVAWLVKAGGEGDPIWDKSLYDMVGSRGNYVEQTSDGGYIFAGDFQVERGDNSETDIFISKFDMAGQHVWQRTYDWGEKGEIEQPDEIHQINDGGYLLASHVNISDYRNNSLVVKLDSEGDILREMLFRSTNMIMAQQTSDGNYALAGQSPEETSEEAVGPIGPTTIWLAKLNDN
jgi:hypothetical protein